MFDPISKTSKQEEQEAPRKATITLENADCMEALKQFKDNYFHLAIVDPPYGIDMGDYRGINGKAGKKKGFGRGQKGNEYKKLYKSKNWDASRPDKAYFDELRRVSRNQIIWGGNYFADLLPASRGWIYWYKNQHHRRFNRFADGELAYTSFDKNLKMVEIAWVGLGYINNEFGEKKIHPTQKPESLYIWLLENYTKSNKERILDTHLGSGSIAIAADKLGFDLWGYELDTEYYEGAVNRLKEHRKQLRLF